MKGAARRRPRTNRGAGPAGAGAWPRAACSMARRPPPRVVRSPVSTRKPSAVVTLRCRRERLERVASCFQPWQDICWRGRGSWRRVGTCAGWPMAYILATKAFDTSSTSSLGLLVLPSTPLPTPSAVACPETARRNTQTTHSEATANRTNCLRALVRLFRLARHIKHASNAPRMSVNTTVTTRSTVDTSPPKRPTSSVGALRGSLYARTGRVGLRWWLPCLLLWNGCLGSASSIART